MDQSDLIRLDLGDSQDAETALRAHRVFSDCVGRRNVIYVHPAADLREARLHFAGTGNTVTFGARSAFSGDIFAFGSGAQAVIHGESASVTAQLNLYAGANFELGERCVIYGMRAWISEGSRLRIGHGCQFSEGITIRTTDHHTIFDMETLKPINAPANVEIEPFVWLGQDVAVLKGVRIGAGSIVGARSVINRNVPRQELWAGSPARRLRERVSWVDALPASAQELAERRTELSLLSETPPARPGTAELNAAVTAACASPRGEALKLLRKRWAYTRAWVASCRWRSSRSGGLGNQDA